MAQNELNSMNVTEGVADATRSFLNRDGYETAREGFKQAAESYLARNGLELYSDIQHAIKQGIESWLDDNRHDVLAAIADGASRRA